MSGDFLDNLGIVLVETSHPGNIGAVARAMKNMGLSRLTLVSPEAFPHEKAYARASGADDVLDQARVVQSLDEAVADCVYIVGASARSRSLTWPVISPRACAGQLWEKRGDGPVALVFGREDSGLTNAELQRCHHHVHIPANPGYSSLNLAMAVQVVSYEARMRWLQACEEQGEDTPLRSILGPDDEGWGERPATNQEFEQFMVHLEQTLIDTGFHNPKRPRQLMMRLRRLFQRAQPDNTEMAILRGILTSVDQKGRHPVASSDGE